MYIAYQCYKCKTVFIIPVEDVERMEMENKYISCPFGHRDIRKVDKYSNIKECMEERKAVLL